MLKYRSSLSSLVALLIVGAFLVLNIYAAEETQVSDKGTPATEEVVLSVTGMT